jgi:hypothetical protein
MPKQWSKRDGRLDDEGRPAVDGAVPDTTGVLVAVVTGSDDSASYPGLLGDVVTRSDDSASYPGLLGDGGTFTKSSDST